MSDKPPENDGFWIYIGASGYLPMLSPDGTEVLIRFRLSDPERHTLQLIAPKDDLALVLPRGDAIRLAEAIRQTALLAKEQ